MGNAIRCYCLTNLGKRMILAVQLPDGSVEKRVHGQSIHIEGGGTVHLSCERCGFDETVLVDKVVQLV